MAAILISVGNIFMKLKLAINEESIYGYLTKPLGWYAIMKTLPV